MERNKEMNVKDIENPGEKRNEELASQETNYIKVSDDIAKNTPNTTLNAINSIISNIQMRGDIGLAFKFKELAEEIITDKNVTDDVRGQILDVFHILANEMYSIRLSHGTRVIRQAIDQLDKLIPSTSVAWSLWDKVRFSFKSLNVL